MGMVYPAANNRQAYQPHQAHQPYQAHQAYQPHQVHQPHQAHQPYQPHQNLPIEVDAPCFPQKVAENIELSGVQANISLHMLDITSFCLILFISRHQKTNISSGTTSPLPDGMSRRRICPDRTCVPQDNTRMRCSPLCSH